jgi:hypothetical protein
VLIPDLLTRDKRIASILRYLVIATVLVCGGLQEARAQSSQPTSSWQGIDILLTPYLWIPWSSVDVSPFDSRIPSASGTVGAGKLISHLTWVPFTGAAEARHDQYGLLIDYMHVPLKAGIDTRGILFGSGTAGSTLNVGTAMGLYRPISRPDQYLDLGLGVRAWGLDGDISLTRGLLPAVSVFRGSSWADPLIAARYHHELGNGFGATAYGDVGGFGISAHVDWQFVGTIDYTARPGVDLHVGFRGMGFDKDMAATQLDVKMYGPFLALTFHL